MAMGRDAVEACRDGAVASRVCRGRQCVVGNGAKTGFWLGPVRPALQLGGLAPHFAGSRTT